MNLENFKNIQEGVDLIILQNGSWYKGIKNKNILYGDFNLHGNKNDFFTYYGGFWMIKDNDDILSGKIQEIIEIKNKNIFLTYTAYFLHLLIEGINFKDVDKCSTDDFNIIFKLGAFSKSLGDFKMILRGDSIINIDFEKNKNLLDSIELSNLIKNNTIIAPMEIIIDEKIEKIKPKKRITVAEIKKEKEEVEKIRNALVSELKEKEEKIKNKEEEIELFKKKKSILEKEAVKKYKKELLTKYKKVKVKSKSNFWDGLIISDLNYKKLSFSYKMRMPLLLKGKAGVGKSSFIKALVEENGGTIVQYNANSETTVENLLGHKILINGDMSWQDGPLTDAVRNGKVFLMDEINASNCGIQYILNGLLENKNGKLGSLAVQGNNGEVIVAHPDFRFYGTYNPGYLGTNSFSNSLMSRFIGIEILPLKEDDEKRLLNQEFSSLGVEIESIVNLANILRQTKDFTYDISTRDLKQSLYFISEGFSIKEAFEATILASVQTIIDEQLITNLFSK